MTTASATRSSRNVKACVAKGDRCITHDAVYPETAAQLGAPCWGAGATGRIGHPGSETEVKFPHVVKALETARAIAADVEAITGCAGSNHVPGCEHFPAAPAVPPAVGAATTSAAAPEPPSVSAEAAPADAPLPEAAPAAGSLLDLPLDLVDVGDNVRVEIEGLEELAASIAEHGVLQPIKATGPHADGRYLVTWGQRRTVASRMAGRATIPAIVLAPDAEVDRHGSARSIEQLVENLHRADLNPIDQAVAMRAVVDGGMSQADLARKLGIAPSTVSNALRLLTLDEGVREKIRAGEITASHGKAIAALPAKQQQDLAESIVRRGLSAHDLEWAIKQRAETAKFEAERAARTEKWVAKIGAALEAYELAKNAEVAIRAETLEYEPVAAAVKAAGFSPARTYAHDRPAKGCDCTITRLTFQRGWKVDGGCTEYEHRMREHDAVRSEDAKARAEFEGRLALIADEVERLLCAAQLPAAALRLIHAATVGYGTPDTITTDDGPRAIAKTLITNWRVREMATPELLAELGIEAES